MTNKEYGKVKDYLDKDGFNFQEKGSRSYAFKRDSDDEKAWPCIKRNFELNETYDDYYKQAVSGSGNEERKIDTIWSSALLALLFFSTAIKKRGITINGICYKKCYFEFKNPVLQNKPHYKHPSNIDCVLMDEDRKNILFIESKFLEYVRDYRKNKIYDGDKLKECYSRSGESTKDLYDWFKKKYEGATYDPHYYGGVKQMITHYSGLCNFVNGCRHWAMEKENDLRKEIIEAHNSGANVSLIEIIFDMSVIDPCFETYKKDYLNLQEDLVKMMKEEQDKKKQQGDPYFTVLEPTTYQELLKDNEKAINDRVKEFYFK